MGKDRNRLKVLLMTTFATLLLASFSASAQQCNRRAVIVTDADVYRTPPRFVTGLGWQGERLDAVANRTQVLKCDERAVPFGLVTKTWSQIAYQRGPDWRYGWVLDEKVQLGLPGSARSDSANHSLAASVVHALVPGAAAATVETPASPSAADGWKIPASAPNPPAAHELPVVASGLPAATPEISELLAPYWPLFLAMVLGMFAKAIVDLLDAGFNRVLVVVHMRRGVVALVVSPIVFLGFLNAGQFEATAATFFVLLLVAFQNGFFWQTLLKRDDLKAPSAAPGH
jgi:hypothetical protein